MKFLPIIFLFVSSFSMAQTAGSPSPTVAPAKAANNQRVGRRPTRVLASARGLNEIYFGSLGSGMLRSEKAAGTSTTLISAHGGFLKQLSREELQVGGEGAFFSSSGGSKSQNYVEAAGVGSWNFGHDMTTAIYAKGGLGIFAVVNDKGEYENKFGFFVGGGKRFPLWSNVQFAPEVRVYKKGSLDPSFEIHFINVSILF